MTIQRRNTTLARPGSGTLSQRLNELSKKCGVDRSDIVTQSARLRAPLNKGQSKCGTIWALLDSSGSMAGDSLEQAKRGLGEFCSAAVGLGYGIGVISFNSHIREIAPFSRDVNGINAALQCLVAEGCTMMAAAIRTSVTCLANEPFERNIFLITDGYANDPQETILEAAIARRAGIDLMTLGTEGADHDFLRKIATRESLARQIPRSQLANGISQTVRLLAGS